MASERRGAIKTSLTEENRFLQHHVFGVMKGNMGFQNDGADVLSCDYF